MPKAKKECNYCKKMLLIKEFTVNKATRDGFSNRCRKCTSEIRKKKRKPVSRIKYDVNRTEKKCKSCNKILPMSSFSKSKNVADGRENKCKSCRKKQRAQGRPVKDINKKRCISCKEILDIKLFSKDKSRNDGYDSTCKDCRNDYHKKYLKNDSNLEKLKIRSKKWREENPKKYKKQKQDYYKKYREEIIKRTSNYHKSQEGRHSLIKAGANQRNIKFNLSKDFVNSFWDAKCYYCNEEIDLPRFDRVDPKKDYSEDNVVPCCISCNYMKNDLKIVDFYQHLERIADFQKTAKKEERAPYVEYSGDPKNDHYLTPFGKFSYYKQQAKNRKIKFDIDYSYFIKFWQKNCKYCGSTIDTVGLDRINNNLGYIEGNINSCCWTCNSMKKDKSVDEFLMKCFNILENKND